MLKRIAVAGVVLALAGFHIAHAQLPSPRADARIERRVSLDEVLLETVRVETQLQAWTLRKVCLDGQAYWVGFGESTQTAISLVYKDGKPEQCRTRAR